MKHIIPYRHAHGLIEALFARRARPRAMPGSPRTATVRQTLARQGERLRWNAEHRQIEIAPRYAAGG